MSTDFWAALKASLAGRSGAAKNKVSADGSLEVLALGGEDFLVEVGTENVAAGRLIRLLLPKTAAEAGTLYKVRLADHSGQKACFTAAAAEPLRTAVADCRISWDTAEKLLPARPGRAHLIDVRTPGEFQAGHVQGARNIEMGTFNRALPAAVPERDDLLIVYCRSGSRSAASAQTIRQMGYKLVLDAGGIMSYRGRPVRG